MRDWTLDALLGAVPETHASLVAALIRAAEQLGLSVFLVGGPVRDLLLDRSILDVDLLVAGRDGIGAEALAQKITGPGVSQRVHGRFGTVTVTRGDASVDLATLRSESYAHPGALPKVAPGTLEQDLRRRDFTVNALALPLSGLGDDDVTSVIDLAGGVRDLEKGLLRILHPLSFHDDPTRALRAARFASRLGFRLSRDSRSPLRDALRDGAFGAVSGDRLRREFEKIFAEALGGVNPGDALARLQGWHVLSALEPGLELSRESVVVLRRLGKLLSDPQWSPRDLRPWVSGLCVWLAPLPAGLRRRTLKRLSVRGDVSRRIADFPRDRDRWVRLLSKSRGRGAADAVLQEIDEERLHALHASCAPTLRRRIVRWAAEDRDRRLPVTGRELVEAGLAGPAVGNALARIRAGWLDGDVANREEALALARELHRRSRATAKRKQEKKTVRPRASSGGGD